MREAQITARVTPELKKEFMKTAKQYGLPLSWLLTMFMRMVVQGKIIPSMVTNDDGERTPALRKAHKQAIKEFERGEAIDFMVSEVSTKNKRSVS
jgi:addiction module RelB/DinJ family antitoxin